MRSFTRGFATWMEHFPLYTALVLTIWLPCNIAVTAITTAMSDNATAAMDLRLPRLFEGIFGPIALGAILFATDQIARRKPVNYRSAMSYGLSIWGRLFATRFVAGLIMMVGFVLLIVPGIVIAVRFSFIEQAVVIDKLDGTPARQRSWDLVPKVIWELIVCGIAFVGFAMAFSAIAYYGLDLLYQGTAMTSLQYDIVDVLIGCILDVTTVPMTIIMYFLYRHASGESIEKDLEEHPDGDPLPSVLDQPDDGNPYKSPLQ